MFPCTHETTRRRRGSLVMVVDIYKQLEWTAVQDLLLFQTLWHTAKTFGGQRSQRFFLSFSLFKYLIIFRAYIVSPLLTVHITALIAGCRTLLLCPSLSNMKVSCWPSSSIVAVSVMDEDSRMFQCCDGPTCRFFFFFFFCPYMYILCVCPPGYILDFLVILRGCLERQEEKLLAPLLASLAQLFCPFGVFHSVPSFSLFVFLAENPGSWDVRYNTQTDEDIFFLGLAFDLTSSRQKKSSSILSKDFSFRLYCHSFSQLVLFLSSCVFGSIPCWACACFLSRRSCSYNGADTGGPLV